LRIALGVYSTYSANEPNSEILAEVISYLFCAEDAGEERPVPGVREPREAALAAGARRRGARQRLAAAARRQEDEGMSFYCGM
jgi:hypothetical protein